MLSWKLEGSGPDLTVIFEGDVTEHAPLAKLAPQIPGPSVTLDVGDITRFNSMGVKNWLTFTESLRERSVVFTLERCSTPVIQQLNMITGFEGSGGCTTVYVPYYCEDCNREDRVLLPMGPDVVDRIAPTMECKKCKGEMEFDDLPEHYERLVKIFA